MEASKPWVKKLLSDAIAPENLSQQLYYDIAKNLEPVIGLKNNPEYYVQFITPQEEKMYDKGPKISSISYLSSDETSDAKMTNDNQKILRMLINPYKLDFIDKRIPDQKLISGQKNLRFGIDKNDIQVQSDEYYDNYLNLVANWLRKNNVNEFEIHAKLKQPADIHGEKPPSDMPYSCCLTVKVAENDLHTASKLQELHDGIIGAHEEISRKTGPTNKSWSR